MDNQHCPEHTNLCENVASIKATLEGMDNRINGSIDDIHSHIKSGSTWRGLIVGLLSAWILSLVAVAFGYGMVHKQVEVNTKKLEIWEATILKCLTMNKGNQDIIDQLKGEIK